MLHLRVGLLFVYLFIEEKREGLMTIKSRVNILRGLLIMALFFASSAWAQNYVERESALKVCQSKVMSRLEALSIGDEKMPRMSTLDSCLSVLIDSHNPKILAQKDVYIEEFHGVMQSDIAVGFFNFWADEENYIQIIKERLSEKELSNFAKVFDGGVDQFVTESYEEIDGWLYGHRLRGIKKVISDFSGAFFISEMKALRVEDTNRFSLEKKADELTDDLNLCFAKWTTIKQLEYCVSALNKYAAADVGDEILLQNLEAHFLPQVESSYHDQVVDTVLDEYKSCLTLYYFDEKPVEKPVQRVKACIYSGMVDGFHEMARVTIAQKLNQLSSFSEEDLDQIVNKSLKSCSRSDLLVGDKSIAYYDKLSLETPEAIEEIALHCKDQMELSVVSAVALMTIQEHEQIKALIGADNAKKLAQEVIEEHYDLCIQKVKKQSLKATPRDCSNYLMAASVFELTENYAAEGIQKILIELGSIELDSDSAKSLLAESNKAMKVCKEKTMTVMVENLDMNARQAEEQITSCLRVGIIDFASALARKILKEEMESNEIFKKYNVELGENKVSSLMTEFDQCFSSQLTAAQDIKNLISSTETSVRGCTRDSMKDVVAFVLDTILSQELISAGLSEAQVKGVIDTYKKRKTNLYKSIENAKSTGEIATLTETGDYVVIQGIAYNVIYLLIRKDTKNYMSKTKTKEFAQKATDKVIACAATATLGDCQKKVTPEIMRGVIRYLLPIEVGKQFNAATKGILSKSQRNRLNVTGLVKYWVTPGKTKTGAALVKYMVDQFVAGKSMSKIQSSHFVRSKIFTILTTSKRFYPNLINEIIQPHLTYHKEHNRGFWEKLGADKRIYTWTNIRNAPSGKKAVAYITSVLEQIIVNNKSFKSSDKDKVIEIVKAAAAEQNKIYGREKRRNSNNN